MSSGTVVMLLKVMEPDGYDDDVIMMIMFFDKTAMVTIVCLVCRIECFRTGKQRQVNELDS